MGNIVLVIHKCYFHFSAANIRTFYKTSKKMQKKNKFLLFEVHSVTCPVVRLCTEKILTRVKMPFFKNVKTGKKSSVA
jgi:hypothetical protein